MSRIDPHANNISLPVASHHNHSAAIRPMHLINSPAIGTMQHEGRRGAKPMVVDMEESIIFFYKGKL
jgi:hypothetical protein